jgi:hypothetical protein
MLERFSDTRVTAWAALFIAPLLPLVGILRFVPVRWAADAEREIAVVLWSLEAALLVAYIVPRLERILSLQAENSLKPATGVEVFNHADDLLRRIGDYTIGALEVSTLNISPAPAHFSPLIAYFDRVNRFLLRGRKAGLRSFRSIASLQDGEKIRSIIARAERLEGSEPISLGVIDPQYWTEDFPLLGIHMVKRPDGYACFVFPRVQLTGRIQAVLIHGQDSYDTLLAYFDELWHNRQVVSLVLEGGRMNDGVLSRLRRHST